MFGQQRKVDPFQVAGQGAFFRLQSQASAPTPTESDPFDIAESDANTCHWRSLNKSYLQSRFFFIADYLQQSPGVEHGSWSRMLLVIY